MPPAIPLIVSVAAASALPATFTIFGLSVAASAALVSGAAGLAASLAVGALTRPHAPDLSASLNNAGAGRTQQIRQPVCPHQIIAGRVKASGVVVFIHARDDTEGKANAWLYLVHAISGTHVRAIYDVYLNDVLASDVSFGPHARVTAHLGAADQAADADFVAEIGEPNWGEDHRLRGRAYVATRLVWNSALFGSGVPNISMIVEGVDDIYDPRSGLTAWSNNPALFIARWFTATWGMRLSWTDLDEDSVIAAANVCDERVRVGGGSATVVPVDDDGFTGALTASSGVRALDVGDGVRLTTTGTLPSGLSLDTTYYVIPGPEGSIKLASTVANAIAGVSVVITSAGSGTHTMTYWDEARYKINGSWTVDAEKGATLKELLSSMAGTAVYIGGKWLLYAGAPATPTVTLDEDDLRGDVQWVPKRSMRDRFNTVRAVYVNPDANWQPVDAPPRTSETYLAEDDDEELVQDVRFTFTASTRGVQRMQKRALESNRREGILQFPAKLTAMRVQAWDGVFVSLARYGWVQKQFRVIGWTLSDDGGVDLTLQEDDAGVDTWDASEELDSAIQQGVVLPNPSEITAPEDVTVTTPTTPTFSHVASQWSEVGSIWLDGYDVEYRDAGGTDWTGYGRVGEDVSREVSLERSIPQDVRVRAVTRNGTPSDFTENLAPGIPTSVSALGAIGQITVTWTNGSGAAEIQFFEGSTLLATVAAGASPQSYAFTGLDSSETHTYQLRTVNDGGNFSDLETVSATTSDGGGD